ncbi:MAG: SAM-dependent methyltransferase [Muribaculaceae bacterium]|nr:SAM-dependent methyltransferase [Muribaculaceae bacterium]
MEKKGTIILFPSLMAPVPVADVLPARNIELIRSVRYFVVEELRTARRFLKACDRSIVIDDLHFEVLNEHTAPEDVEAMLAPAMQGHDIGVISEAGCPAVADPGADLVALAQRKGLEVMPLVGPSSILMGLMGSGFNGQSFAFSGYLPIDAKARSSRLKQMEQRIRNERQTQIFIETPYRNNRLIAELASSLPGDMLLCVACDITSPEQSIRTLPLSRWKTEKFNYDKRPTIFLLYR